MMCFVEGNIIGTPGVSGYLQAPVEIDYDSCKVRLNPNFKMARLEDWRKDLKEQIISEERLYNEHYTT